MTLRYADRVHEQIVVTGTGPVTVGTPVAGYLGFSQVPQIANGDTFYYTAFDPVVLVWEIGLGTWIAGSPNMFSRTPLQSVSALGALSASPVNFGGNLCLVFLDLPSFALPTLQYRHVSSTYTAAGAIAVTDDISIISSSSALAMTLAPGTMDGRAQTIKNYGSGSPTITAMLDGSSRAATLGAAGSASSVLRVRWIASLSSYIVE